MSTLSASSVPWVWPITTLSSVAIAVPPVGWLFRSCRAKCKPEDLVRAGVALAGCAAEGVDRRSDFDVREAEVLEHRLPARTGQPARDSAGPEVDVAQRLGRDRPAVGDVGVLERAAGPE